VIRIGSRGSALALWQAEYTKARLTEAYAGLDVEIEIIHTTGDRITDVPLSKIGDKGLFTKELDRALLDDRVHLAVHSLKDVPTHVEPGLALVAVGKREDPSDALIAGPGMPGKLMDLPAGSRIGTSSLRRRAQLLALRPDVIVTDLRGNLDTRLAAVHAGQYDAIILALAGMKRLGRAAEATDVLGGAWLPAVGQGALGMICRADDAETKSLLRVLDDADTHAATNAERALLRRLEGGCQIPIAALAQVSGDNLWLQALVASVNGTRIVRGELSGNRTDAESIGMSLAHELLERGAGTILEELRAANPPVPEPPAP
jgi:hydroxymethylbilane synthase